MLYVDTCAFCNLPQLTNLTLNRHLHIRLSHSLLALYGLQNQTLELVDFSYNHHGLPTILDETNTLYLNNVCIKTLRMHLVDIGGIASGAFRSYGALSKCLKHVDLSKNSLTVASRSVFIKLSIELINIESMQLQNQRSFLLESKHDGGVGITAEAPKFPDLVTYVNLSPNLKLLNLSAGVRDLSYLPRHIHFTHSGTLTVLDLSYCGAYDCDIAITGLTNIHTFDFSGNDCHVLGARLFGHMTTLRRLRLANVHLREEFLLANGTELLRPLVDLEELDLADNNLHDLPSNLLRHQPRLQRLVLAGNRFQVRAISFCTLILNEVIQVTI